MADSTPVTLVTGFLGAGKTTLIAELLRHPGLDGTLVVVNEFGEVGIDHDLLESSSEDTILLANGCLCCTIRGNMIDTLASAEAQRAEGRLRPFDRVVVETSGLADPAPFLSFLYGEAAFAARYAISGVVTVCDPTTGRDVLRTYPEAVSQVRMADRLVLSKVDVARPADVEAMKAELRRLNPDADMVSAALGRIDPALILDIDHRAPEAIAPYAHHHEDGAEVSMRHHGIGRAAFRVPRLDRDGYEALLAILRSFPGDHLPRIKGILTVSFDDRPVVLQGALGTLAPMTWLPGPGRPSGTLVALTRGDPGPLAEKLNPLGLQPL
ncbi:MAG: GTP-binding protein [Alphaproteobacteria bacterium]|nr:GTP-binding protein [Alphaproteobacteria bacterium]